MSRIPGIDLETADAYAKRVFELQVERWGAPLLKSPRLRAPADDPASSARHVGRDRRLGADRRTPASAAEPARRPAQRLRVLKRHQRCGR